MTATSACLYLACGLSPTRFGLPTHRSYRRSSAMARAAAAGVECNRAHALLPFSERHLVHEPKPGTIQVRERHPRESGLGKGAHPAARVNESCELLRRRQWFGLATAWTLRCSRRSMWLSPSVRIPLGAVVLIGTRKYAEEHVCVTPIVVPDSAWPRWH